MGKKYFRVHSTDIIKKVDGKDISRNEKKLCLGVKYSRRRKKDIKRSRLRFLGEGEN
jgi:hypothetical protein